MKLDASDIRYLSSDTFRVLTAVEMGSKNHEIVPTALIANLAGLRSGGVNKCISELAKRGLVKREANSKCMFVCFSHLSLLETHMNVKENKTDMRYIGMIQIQR